MITGRFPLFVLAAMCLSHWGCRPKRDTIEVVYNCPANAAEIATLQQEIPAFAARSRVTIKLNPFTGQDKLYAMMVAGQTPDIFYTNSTMRDRLAAEGRLLDLRTVSRGDSFVQRLWPAIVETGTSTDSGWYSVGNWSFTLGVYYNKDIFDKAGVPYPDSGWTWETMVKRAQKLTHDDNGDGMPDRYGVFIGSHFVEAFEQMNGAGIHPHMLRAEVNPASAEVFRKYLSLMNDGIMPDLRRIQAMGMQPLQLLESGRVAMLVEAVPHQTLIEMLRIRWGVVPLPSFAGIPPKYFRSGSGGLSISSGTKHPEAVWQALKWIIAEARTYQPNPVLRDVDFVGGWEHRYPQLKGSGFREVWDVSLKWDGGDPRFFVRFSSWTSASILERLQPLLDRMWARELPVEGLVAALPVVNAHVPRDLRDLLAQPGLRPAFRADILRELESLDNAPAR